MNTRTISIKVTYTVPLFHEGRTQSDVIYSRGVLSGRSRDQLLNEDHGVLPLVSYATEGDRFADEISTSHVDSFFSIWLSEVYHRKGINHNGVYSESWATDLIWTVDRVLTINLD